MNKENIAPLEVFEDDCLWYVKKNGRILFSGLDEPSPEYLALLASYFGGGNE